ncbi:complement factor I isoform X2 [Pristis pectinata]|uniref:complement factor I isoform X2 n=1 Tax=Pristis pectinata TaxID=685728 RepID=UPI00223D97F9|nr:complement factor I isoform X2 [Pristis pectinata]
MSKRFDYQQKAVKPLISTQAISKHRQRLSEDCLVKKYTYKSCQKVFCQPWEKCIRGSCTCKLPYQCPKNGETVCSSKNKTYRSYCQLKSIECLRKSERFAHSGVCSLGRTDAYLGVANSSQGIVLFGLNHSVGSPVCLKKMWTMHEANVVCRQLNFNLGAEKLLKEAPGKWKNYSMFIWTNKTRCRGFETSLSECFQHKDIGRPEGLCEGNHIAAVKCYQYPPDKNCTSDEFECVNGKCIPLENVCNGIDDCADLSDELCCKECTDSYLCKSGICIPHFSLCDGEDDCLDGGDESKCNEMDTIKDYKTERSQLKSSLSKISCGISNVTANTASKRSKRLIGGTEALKGQFPWQIAVYDGEILNCGGIFIGGCWILTAAHCLRSHRISNYVVRIAKYNKRDISKREEILPVEKMIVHYKYNSKTYENDIALLKIKHIFKNEECIPLSEDVQPVCVPWSDYLFRPNKTCIVSGWGQAKDNTRVSILRWAEVDIIGNCLSIYKSAFFDGMECAGKLDGTADSCKGDSGGPLVCTDERNEAYVWGVVSWGEKCGEPGYPGVYTKVSHYFDWITDHVRGHVISKYNV